MWSLDWIRPITFTCFCRKKHISYYKMLFVYRFCKLFSLTYMTYIWHIFYLFILHYYSCQSSIRSVLNLDCASPLGVRVFLISKNLLDILRLATTLQCTLYRHSTCVALTPVPTLRSNRWRNCHSPWHSSMDLFWRYGRRLSNNMHMHMFIAFHTTHLQHMRLLNGHHFFFPKVIKLNDSTNIAHIRNTFLCWRP